MLVSVASHSESCLLSSWGENCNPKKQIPCWPGETDNLMPKEAALPQGIRDILHAGFGFARNGFVLIPNICNFAYKTIHTRPGIQDAIFSGGSIPWR